MNYELFNIEEIKLREVKGCFTTILKNAGELLDKK